MHYYFQVQAQIRSARYLNFVVWREEELLVQRTCMYLDEPFITMALEKCIRFIPVGVLPELVGSVVSSIDSQMLWVCV